MRILLVADMRSPHALGWVSGILEMGFKDMIFSRALEKEHLGSLPEEVASAIVAIAADPLSRARSGLLRSERAETSQTRSPRRRGVCLGKQLFDSRGNFTDRVCARVTNRGPIEQNRHILVSSPQASSRPCTARPI